MMYLVNTSSVEISESLLVGKVGVASFKST